MQAVSSDFAIERLAGDALRQIPLLKHARLLGAAAAYEWDPDLEFAALRHSPAATHWDGAAYADFDSVSLLSRGDAACLGRYLERLGAGRHIVKSAGGPPFEPAGWRCRRLRSFLSFTVGAADLIRRDGWAGAGVELARAGAATAAWAPVLAVGGYGLAEVDGLLQGGGALFGVLADGRPAACCAAYPNFGPVWEIGCVATDPGRRRRGLAGAAVGAATDYLLAAGLTPRYQCDAGNAASAGLAAACGYRLFLTFNHDAYYR